MSDWYYDDYDMDSVDVEILDRRKESYYKEQDIVIGDIRDGDPSAYRRLLRLARKAGISLWEAFVEYGDPRS